MKNLIYAIILLTPICSFGQAPYAFNYQGIATDMDGNPISNSNISILIEVLRESEAGSVEYGEEHQVLTDSRGVFSLRIGEGDQFIGNIRNIDWGVDRYFISTEIDIEGGDNYMPLGASQLYSVPYALYAATAGDGTAGDNQNLTLRGDLLSIENGNTIDLSTLKIVESDGDSTNELQKLSINGNILSISDGNSIELPIDETNVGTDDQILTLLGTVLSIENGNTIDLASLSGGDSFWQQDGPFSIFYDGAIGVNLIDQRLITLADNTAGSGYAEFFGENDSRNVIISSLSSNYGIIGLSDENSNAKWQSYVAANGSGTTWLGGDNGEANVFISSLDNNENQGFIGVYDAQGAPSASMYPGSSGQGYVVTNGSNGNTNTQMTWLSGSNNNGYISVHDSQGNEEAGLYVNSAGQGVVFADVKNFKMNHPAEEDHEIVYASIEGPEAGAYVRGTSSLINGTAEVQFPDHFTYVNSGTEGMTVMLTPLSANSMGMAVIKKSKSGFIVKELHGGGGNYRFDWEVKGVRAGYENYKAVRPKTSGDKLSDVPKKVQPNISSISSGKRIR